MPVRSFFILILLGIFALASSAKAEESLFPFVVSYDAPQNVTNLSGWLSRPAGKHGFVRLHDGRLAVMQNGRATPQRFWATNFCFDACFPEKEQAERVAARLARWGINCVRMHHMDMRNIWGNAPAKLTPDPGQLDRLDYLIYQLKRHGIYTNLNLHVSRWLDAAEGFPHRDRRPLFDKGLDNFEPRMIKLQKKYARDLLTHVNPYTKTTYIDEPAVAFVEINNENALMHEWTGGSLDRLGEPYAGTFRRLWNAWLKNKYGSTEKLRAAWNVGERPLGAEMLKNGNFTRPLEPPWVLERDAQTRAKLAVLQGGPDGRRYARLEVRQNGAVAWHPQFYQTGLAVQKGEAYTLRFQARSNWKQSLDVNCMMAHDPWQRLGLATSFEVGPRWRAYRFAFVAERDDAQARIGFVNFIPGTFEFADLSLRPGGIVGLPTGQLLENETVAILPRHELSRTETARNDFIQFLWDTERDYWSGMYRYLKEELKVQSLVAGTQLGWSPVYVQAGLDYLDAHAYWQHPEFPHRPWDPVDWRMKNTAMVGAPPGTLGQLAARRVAGRPFTVSEYNHPVPNAYAAEGFPMLAAVGAFQGWDGLYSFCYGHTADFEPRKIANFFDINSDAAKLAHLPACAAMFLRGDVAPARQTLTAELSPETERKILRQTFSAGSLSTGQLGLPEWLALRHAIALDIGNGASNPSVRDSVTTKKMPQSFVSDTGQIRWDASQEDAGCFLVDTPRTKLFTGFVRGRTFHLGDVELKIGPTRLDWATVSLVCLDGDGFDGPGRILLAATGWEQNQDWQLRRLSDHYVTLGDKWGRLPVLCEGIPAEIRLPVDAGLVTFYPLDPSGNRRPALPASARDGKAVLRLDPKHRTVWYEVEIAGKE